MTSIDVKDASNATQTVQVTVPGTAGTPSVDVISMQGVASGIPAAVVGSGKIATATFTRPADTTLYTALDVIANSTSAPTVLEFDVARVAGGSGYFTGSRAATDQKTNTARGRMHLFSVAPTAINDNSPYLKLWANRTAKIGVIDYPAMATEDPTNSTGADSQNVTIRLPFKCATGDTKVYGIYETLDGFTPGSAQTYFFELFVEQN